jgi:hypothetical protein
MVGHTSEYEREYNKENLLVGFGVDTHLDYDIELKKGDNDEIQHDLWLHQYLWISDVYCFSISGCPHGILG